MFCICIIKDCPKPISFIPYIVYPKKFKISKHFIKFLFFFKNFKKNSKLKKFQIPPKNFKIFIFFLNSKHLKMFIKYMYYQRHGWNIWYNEHYMSKSVSHAISTLDLYHHSARWPLVWYRVLGLIWHVIQILTCNIQYILNAQKVTRGEHNISKLLQTP